MPEEDFRAAEMKWLQEHSAEIGPRYAGEWIAIDGSQLVAHARDLTTLMREANEIGHPNPFVTTVPAEPNVVLIL